MSTRMSTRMTPRLALLGVGSHCHNEHLPVLRQLQADPQAAARLVAVCDRDLAKAQRVAAEFGNIAVFADVEDLLAAQCCDALIAVTPVTVTAAIAQRVIAAGLPLCMEKPLGTTLAEARAVVAAQQHSTTPVMVGMNRRFDPLLLRASELLQQRQPAYARYTLARPARAESGFIDDVCIHAVDWLAATLGPARLVQAQPLGALPGEGLVATLSCGAVPTTLEVLPTVGCWRETLVVGGDGWLLEVVWGQGLSFRQRGQDPIIMDPPAKGASTWHETQAFIAAVAGRGPWSPNPAEVYHAMDITEQLTQAWQTGTGVR